MATTTAGPAADLTPEQRQSVRLTLRSPRHLKTEVLAGLVVALALIPEAIAFSIIAGVDPRLGLFASFTMAVTTAVLGGRPAMISAATGAVALVIAPLVASHGIDYFIAAVILAGVFQVVLALIGAARLMRGRSRATPAAPASPAPVVLRNARRETRVLPPPWEHRCGRPSSSRPLAHPQDGEHRRPLG